MFEIRSVDDASERGHDGQVLDVVVPEFSIASSSLSATHALRWGRRKAPCRSPWRTLGKRIGNGDVGRGVGVGDGVVAASMEHVDA
jgi:hypothetical protein